LIGSFVRAFDRRKALPFAFGVHVCRAGISPEVFYLKLDPAQFDNVSFVQAVVLLEHLDLIDGTYYFILGGLKIPNNNEHLVVDIFIEQFSLLFIHEGKQGVIFNEKFT